MILHFHRVPCFQSRLHGVENYPVVCFIRFSRYVCFSMCDASVVSQRCSCEIDFVAAAFLVHVCAQTGWTALMMASEYGHAHCLQLLLDAGADKNSQAKVRASQSAASEMLLSGVGGGRSIAMINCLSRFFNSLIALMLRCVSPLHICCTHTCAQTGSTALIWAGRYGRADCLRLLLDAGADKDASDKVYPFGCIVV
jgi:hypothetical protein